MIKLVCNDRLKVLGKGDDVKLEGDVRGTIVAVYPPTDETQTGKVSVADKGRRSVNLYTPEEINAQFMEVRSSFEQAHDRRASNDG